MTDDGRLGLRERKKRETRDALSLATIRLAVERGWDAVTIDDIAAAANVSVRTFRNYFSSKAEAIATRHLDRMARIAEELRSRPADEPLWDAIAHSVTTQFLPGEDPPPDPHRAEATRLMLADPAVHGAVLRADALAQAQLAAAIAARTGTDVERDLYPKLVAATIGAAVGVAIGHALNAEPPVALIPLIHDVLGSLTAGLPSPVGSRS
jgi:AcrR family transcriptional regulator